MQAFVNCLQNFIITVLFYFDFCMQKEAQDPQVSPGRVKQFLCAYFNFSGGANQTGAWSYRGVETVFINETHVQCTSSHLTSFVVLVMTVPATQPVSACMLVQHRHPDVILGHTLTLFIIPFSVLSCHRRHSLTPSYTLAVSLLSSAFLLVSSFMLYL